MPSTNKFIWTSTRQRYESSLSWKKTFWKVVLITGDTRMGEVLGRLLSTAKGVNYWDSPLKVPSFHPIFYFASFPFVFYHVSSLRHDRTQNLVLWSTSSPLFLAPVLLGEAQSLPQRTWDPSQHQVKVSKWYQRRSSLKELLIPDCWRVSSSASFASSLFSRLLKLLKLLLQGCLICQVEFWGKVTLCSNCLIKKSFQLEFLDKK